MDPREISDERYDWLSGEMKSWTARGLLSDDQAGRILGLYGSAEERAVRRGGEAVSAIMSLAAVLVGLGVLLLAAFNWTALSSGVKAGLLVAAMLASHGAGWFLRFRAGSQAVSEALFFLGCLFYGASIGQIGDDFRVVAGVSDGFWWWAVGVLPFALATGGSALHVLTALILGGYTGVATLGRLMEGAGEGGAGWWSAAALSVPFLAAPGLVWAYRRTSVVGVAIYAVLLSGWVLVQPAAWRLDDAPVFWAGSVGALLLLIAECHPLRSALAVPYRTLGVQLAGVVLLLLGFHGFDRDALDRLPMKTVILETSVSVVAAGILVLLAEGFERRRSVLPAPRGVGPTILNERRRGPLGLVLLMAAMSLWNALVGDPLGLALAANVAIPALAIWLMSVGLREDRGRPFTVGVLYLLTWAVCRYIDLFGDFGGVLGAALMFFLCGAALFGVARFWQHRTRKDFLHV